MNEENEYKEVIFTLRILGIILTTVILLYMFPAVVMLAVISFVLLFLFTVWFIVGLSRRYNESSEEYYDLDD